MKNIIVTGANQGIGLAKRINKKSYIICHSAGQKLQTLLWYLFPIKMGNLMSKMTKSYAEQQSKDSLNT